MPFTASLQDARAGCGRSHGRRGLNVTVWLRKQGFEQAQWVAGGIEAWAALVDRRWGDNRSQFSVVSGRRFERPGDRRYAT